MNFKKYIIMILMVILSTSAFSNIRIKVLSNSTKLNKKIYTYEVTDEINGNPIVRNFYLVITKDKNKVNKKLYTYRNVFDNKDKFIIDEEAINEKIYEITTKYDDKERIVSTNEKSYLISLDHIDMIMYVPIKTLKTSYKYYSKKEKQKLKIEDTGIMKYEKFYKKIFYGSGEISAKKLEKIITYLIPESKIEEYNILDLGILKEEIQNNDEEEIFLRGSIAF
ncbi:MAG: hypothetical protein Q7K48_07185 [Fusobacterium sp. JB021]|nr:hypothetical protein [Fusobacterium sp. JB021]MDP0507195.1 hypothetical protein [Fusobacterium sp. JB019]